MCCWHRIDASKQSGNIADGVLLDACSVYWYAGEVVGGVHFFSVEPVSFLGAEVGAVHCGALRLSSRCLCSLQVHVYVCTM